MVRRIALVNHIFFDYPQRKVGGNMSKCLNFLMVLIVISYSQFIFAYGDAIIESKKAFINCERADLLPLLESAKVLENWGSGYEGSGCETTIFEANSNGQLVYISAYMCGDYDAASVSEINLRYTTAPGVLPKENDRNSFFSYSTYNGQNICK